MTGWLLIVDDDRDVREALDAVLEAYDYDVGLAAGGDEALALLGKRGRATLALLDLRMPGMSGEALQEKLLERYVNDPIPVIVMSGEPFVEDTVRRMKAKQFLAKPVALPTLLEALERWSEDEVPRLC